MFDLKKLKPRAANAGKIKNPYIHYLILGLFFGVGALTLVGHTFAHSLSDDHDEHSHSHNVVNQCPSGPAKTYELIFGDTSVTPSQLSVNKCDQINVRNEGSAPIELAMGPHAHHIHVEGFEETVLNHGQLYSFRLSQLGNYSIHDHENESLNSKIIVND
jgi:hypothetical protein